ncbi:MAG TPA: zinc metallopeptidase, partial [Coriobacteriia bacterium]|nr:zinc metallopeptidase [Coriobacteriia bacterium]
MFESYLPILIVAVVLGLLTQGFVNASYRRYSKVPLATGQSGVEVARRMLEAEGLGRVGIEMV